MSEVKKNSKYIEGVRVDFGLSEDDFLNLVRNAVEDQSGSRYICTVNPEFIIKAQRDNSFKDTINNAYLSVPDGVGVLMAEKYLESIKSVSRKNPFFPIIYFIKGVQVGFKSMFDTNFLGNRLAGSNLIYSMCALAEKSHWSIFLLGGWEKDKLGRMTTDNGNIAKRASTKLKQMYPNLRIIGASSEFSDKEYDDEKTVNYMKNIMSQEGVDTIDIVFVAYSFGNQEKWMARNLMKLPAKLGIGVGGTFDQITGSQPRCPKFLVNLHLEWLFRLTTQPWRIKRVLTAFPLFPYRLFVSSLKQK